MQPLTGRLEEIAELLQRLNHALDKAADEGYDLKAHILSHDGDYDQSHADQIRIIEHRCIV